MKKLIMLSLLTIAVSAHAGNDGGGGGGIVIDGKVLLLDLVEASRPKEQGGLTEKGLNIVESQESVEVQVERALSRLDMWRQAANLDLGLASEVRNTHAEILKITRNISASYDLAFPVDANLNFISRNDKLVGIARWETDHTGKETLWLDNKYHSLMSNTHKAALEVHEAVYKVLRAKLNHQDSKLTRAIVGYLFSDLKPKKLSADAERNIRVSVQADVERSNSKQCNLNLMVGDQQFNISSQSPVSRRYVLLSSDSVNDVVFSKVTAQPCYYRITIENEAGTIFRVRNLDWTARAQASSEMVGVLKPTDFRKDFSAKPYVLDIPVRL